MGVIFWGSKSSRKMPKPKRSTFGWPPKSFKSACRSKTEEIDDVMSNVTVSVETCTVHGEKT